MANPNRNAPTDKIIKYARNTLIAGSVIAALGLGVYGISNNSNRISDNKDEITKTNSRVEKLEKAAPVTLSIPKNDKLERKLDFLAFTDMDADGIADQVYIAPNQSYGQNKDNFGVFYFKNKNGDIKKFGQNGSPLEVKKYLEEAICEGKDIGAWKYGLDQGVEELLRTSFRMQGQYPKSSGKELSLDKLGKMYNANIKSK